MRKELHLTAVEKQDLLLGAKIRKEKSLASHIKKCALKQNDEYIKYQFNDQPAKLNRVFASKEDLL
jgi:hypothetical protein